MTEEPAQPPQNADAKPARKPAADKELEPLRAGNPGQGKTGARVSEPAAVILASDLSRWIIAKVGKFPRQVRYGLGARIEGAHLDVLEELVAAQYARGGEREKALERANRRLQVARHLVRMAREMGLISEKPAVYVAGLQFELGNQVGAWRKASAATANSSASSASRAT